MVILILKKNSKMTMEDKHVTVHNVMFYNQEPRAIHSMSINRKLKLLALSRSDNSVEIWNVQNTPFLQKWVPCSPNTSVEDLKWCDSRLLSCGLQGTVLEYDLITETLKDSTSVTGGVAWCLDFCPANNLVAVGTEDGLINILTVTEYNLEHLKFLDRQQGRVLCLQWHENGEQLVTGSVDVIRVWSLATGHALHKLTTGRSHSNKETIVWSLSVTRDLTILSGDSRGMLCVWDGKLGVQIESFQSHAADILSVALSEDESYVFCSGVDPLVVMFGRVSEKANAKRQWAKGGMRRTHDHDVRALATSGSSGLYSGGVDGFLAYTSYPPKIKTKCPPFLKGKCVEVSVDCRRVLLRYLDKVELWALGDTRLSESPTCLLRLQAPAGDVLLSSALSPDSSYIVYSTQSTTSFFRLKLSETSLEKLSSFPAEPEPSKLICTYVAGTSQACVCVSRSNIIRVFHFTPNGLEEVHSFTPADSSALKNCITHMSISTNGELLVAADSDSHVCVWSTTTWNLVATLPTYKSPPLAIAVSDTTNAVYVAYGDFKVVEYDLKEQKYTRFSKKIERSLAEILTTSINGFLFDARHPKQLLVYTDLIICAINKTKIEGKKEFKARKSIATEESNGDDSHDAFQCIKSFKHVAGAAWLKGEELVVVEVTPLALTECLPPTLYKKKFGR